MTDKQEAYFKMKREQLMDNLANALIDIAILEVQQHDGVVTEELVNKRVAGYILRPIDEVFPEVRIKMNEDQ